MNGSQVSNTPSDWGDFLESMVGLFQSQGQEWSRLFTRALDGSLRPRPAGPGAASPTEAGTSPGTRRDGGDGAAAKDRSGAPTAMESPEALRSWGFVVQSVLGFLQQQGIDLSELFKAGLAGNLKADALVNFAFRTWSQALGSMLGLGQSLSAAAGQIPSVIFIIDEVSETAPPQVIPFKGARENARLFNTDVVLIGGPLSPSNKPGEEATPGIPKRRGMKASVRSRFKGSSQIEVRLVGLSGQPLEPGLYSGMVFSRQPAETRPVPQALIWVFAELKQTRDAKGLVSFSGTQGMRSPSEEPRTPEDEFWNRSEEA
jgi:hypothetical protein